MLQKQYICTVEYKKIQTSKKKSIRSPPSTIYTLVRIFLSLFEHGFTHICPYEIYTVVHTVL